MNRNVTPADAPTKAPRRDRRDWRREYDAPRAMRPTPKRQGTRQAQLAAATREGGY